MSSSKMEIPGQKTHPLAIAGTVMAFIPLFNCLAFPVSIVALVRTNNNNLKYKGMGLCIAAIIVSLITSALMIPIIPLVIAEIKRNSWAMQSVDNQRNIGTAYTQYLGDNEGWYPRVRGSAGVGGKQGNAMGGDRPLPNIVSRLYGAKVPEGDRPLNKYVGNLEIFHDPADGGGGLYNVPSYWESFGNSYQPSVADDVFRVKRVLGEKTEKKDSYEATSLHEQEISKSPANKIIQGDWNWPYDREDAWHSDIGLGKHIMLYGDGHVEQFTFPPTSTMTNWFLSPPPDSNYKWW